MINGKGGSNAGVMKHVGEAIKSTSLNPNQKIVVLGIPNWCTVKNNTSLIKKHVDFKTLNKTLIYLKDPDFSIFL